MRQKLPHHAGHSLPEGLKSTLLSINLLSLYSQIKEMIGNHGAVKSKVTKHKEPANYIQIILNTL